jgi:uncharacterized protein YjbI with pentapeptide repeats
MSPLGRLLLIGLGLWIICLSPAYGLEKPPGKPWTGKLKGKEITQADLDKILSEHKLWVESKGEKGDQADLRKSSLREANLSGANLGYANLSGAFLLEANLSGAKLFKADMSRARLFKGNLSGANLFEANLSGANLAEADLSRASMDGANLSGADLARANLSRANLYKANLSAAVLWNANLNKANLYEADLSRANLSKTSLDSAEIWEANLSGVRFEPQPGTLPGVTSLLKIKGLDSLTFTGTSSFGLMELRKIYKEAGMRDEERQVTFSLNHTRREQLWAEEVVVAGEKKRLEKGFFSKLESLFHLVFFEWTCDYGMSPGRPLQIMGFGLLIFIFPYLLALRSRDQETGIWLLLPSDRVLDRKLKDRPFKLTNHRPFRPLPHDSTRFGEIFLRRWRMLRLASYFSLLSAFHIGWRDLNVGSWIARLQRREYNLRATGWVRTVSGLQSLLSVYMLALWALSYFGRPFE